MKRISRLTVILLILAQQAMAQSSSTEIWVSDITVKDNKTVFGTPYRITDNDYYDNQPCFSADGSLMYFASMPDTVQTDIYEYNFKKKNARQITTSAESEFQPQLIPYAKKLLSVVRIDSDKAQRFYQVDLDGNNDFQLLMPNEDSVAYYCWINDTTVGAYMLNGEGGILQQFDMKPQQSIILMNGGFGRCLVKIPGTTMFTYVQKGSDGAYTLMRYDMTTEERMPVAVMPEKTEDYCFSTDGRVLCGVKGKLMSFDTKNEKATWIEVADWSKITGEFYRMAYSPAGNRIAIVTYKGERP